MMHSPAQPVRAPDPDETVDLDELIEEVVPDAATWKDTPNPVFGGETPAETMKTPQGQQILRDVLRAAKNGMVS